jgi:hypothetical protein
VDSPDGPLRLFWLDLHCHSVLSPDAEGEPDELLAYGRDIAGLDGMAIVDNDYYPNKALSQAEWRHEQELAEAWTEAGRFIVFPAYEYTFHNEALTPDFNHRYVVYRRNGPLVRRIDPEGFTLEDLIGHIPPDDTMLVAHHPTWVLSGEVPEHVEVASSWRVCIEETDFIGKRLAAGDRFGFVASSDSHRACPGMGGALTGVYARALTRDDVFDALRRGRTVATQGSRVRIDFRVGDLFVGEEGDVHGNPILRVRVEAPRPVEYIELVRDGRVVSRLGGEGPSVTAELSDESASPGEHSYFARVKMEGDPSFNAPDDPPDFYKPFRTDGRYPSNLARARGPFAWTSPIRARVRR